MTRSLKAGLGLSMLVALLVAAFGAITASATTDGHFVSSATTTSFDITESTAEPSTHKTVLSAYGATVECHQATYTAANATAATFTQLTVTPEYKNCTTGSGGAATVRMNGCHYLFTSRAGEKHATAHFLCPVGKKAEVESSAGLEKFGAQTPTTNGVVYTNQGDGTITADITVEGIHAECHGACQLLGTNTTTAKLTGSVTIKGTNAATGGSATISAT